MKTKRFNDFLALIIVVAIVALWILDPVLKARVGFGLPEQTVGASIALLMLVGQYYYRKKQGEPPTSS